MKIRKRYGFTIFLGLTFGSVFLEQGQQHVDRSAYTDPTPVAVSYDDLFTNGMPENQNMTISDFRVAKDAETKSIRSTTYVPLYPVNARKRGENGDAIIAQFFDPPHEVRRQLNTGELTGVVWKRDSKSKDMDHSDIRSLFPTVTSKNYEVMIVDYEPLSRRGAYNMIAAGHFCHALCCFAGLGILIDWTKVADKKAGQPKPKAMSETAA